MSSLFELLPDDILRTVLHEWMDNADVRNITAFDIAICQGEMRQKYLVCVKNRKLSISTHQFTDILTIHNKFESCLNWVSSRSSSISCLSLTDIVMRYINWHKIEDVEYLTIEMRNNFFDIHELLHCLPKLKKLKLTGYGSVQINDSAFEKVLVEFALEQFEWTQRIYFENSIDTFRYLGEHALKLKKIELDSDCEGESSILLTILRFLPNLQELVFQRDISEYRYISDEDEDFDPKAELQYMINNLFGQFHPFSTVKFPALHSITYLGDSLLLSHILPKCPNLQTLILYRLLGDNYPQIVDNILSISCNLKKVRLVDLGEQESMKILSKQVSCKNSQLKELAVRGVLHLLLPIIASLAPSLEKLTVDAAYRNLTGKNTKFDYLPVTMPHVKELTLQSYTFSRTESYEELFAACAMIFPNLEFLYISSSVVQHNLDMLHCLFASPLMYQLHTLKIHGSFGQSNKTMVPMTIQGQKWDKLKHFIISHFLPEFRDWDGLFLMAPNLETLKLTQNDSWLETATFENAKRLKVFDCEIRNNTKVEIFLIQQKLRACPSMEKFYLKKFDISPYGGGECYPLWTIDSIDQLRLLKKEFPHVEFLYRAIRMEERTNSGTYNEDEENEDMIIAQQ